MTPKNDPFPDITDHQLVEICRESMRRELAARKLHRRYDTGYRSIAVMLYRTRHPNLQVSEIEATLGLSVDRIYNADRGRSEMPRGAGPYAWLKGRICQTFLQGHLDTFAAEAAGHPPESAEPASKRPGRAPANRLDRTQWRGTGRPASPGR